MSTQPPQTLRRKIVAEGVGTAFLVAAVVGSGIMGDNLSGGNDALTLLANTLSTGFALIVLILVFAPISGAHFNPVVSFLFAANRTLPWKDFFFYVPAQIVGGIAGTVIAHAMYGLPLIELSSHMRHGSGEWLGEILATFGLLLTIFGCLRAKPDSVPYAVGLFIMSAYWFTSSTSFANPAVTIARAFTDSFAGIRPADVPAFLLAQIAGMALAFGFVQWLFKR